MSTVFTEFVLSLGDECVVGTELLVAIRRHLTSTLRKRGIYDFGPSLLGYSGSRWNDEESMQDLVHDCLGRAILARLPRLLELVKTNGSVDGAVVQNIKRFVWEKQRQQDRVGFAVFQNLKAAVAELIANDELRRLNEKDESESDFTADSEFSIKGASYGSVSSERQLKEALLASGLMFDGLQSFTTASHKGREILIETVVSLKAFGVTAFSIDSLKKALCSLISESRAVGTVTSRQILRDVFEDSSENSRTVPPDTGYEESESNALMVKLICLEIDNSRRTQAVRERLHQVLNLAADAWAGKNSSGEFSVEGLQSTLGIERTTVYDDLKFLASLRERVIAQRSLTNNHGEQHG